MSSVAYHFVANFLLFQKPFFNNFACTRHYWATSASCRACTTLALKGVKCNALCGKRSFRGSSVSEAGIIKLD